MNRDELVKVARGEMPAEVPQRRQPLFVVEQVVKAAREKGQWKGAAKRKGPGIPRDKRDAFPQARLFAQLVLEHSSHRW